MKGVGEEGGLGFKAQRRNDWNKDRCTSAELAGMGMIVRAVDVDRIISG